jgi:hypothetical protein
MRWRCGRARSRFRPVRSGRHGLNSSWKESAFLARLGRFGAKGELGISGAKATGIEMK